MVKYLVGYRILEIREELSENWIWELLGYRWIWCKENGLECTKREGDLGLSF